MVERQNVSVVTYHTYLRMKQYVLYNDIIRYRNIFDNNGTPLLIWIQQIFQRNPFLVHIFSILPLHYSIENIKRQFYSLNAKGLPSENY